MEIYNSTEQFDKNRKTGSVIALGSFDALHIAHQKLIGAALARAREKGLLCGVDLFDQRPEWVITGKSTADCILTNEAKTAILAEMGVDFVCFEHFDESFMSLSCEEFALSLRERFGIKCAVAGYHYRFGSKGGGDVNTLRELGERFGFEVLVIDAVKLEDQVVSSTRIRSLISRGEVSRAADFLGRPFFLQGAVESGYQIGRTLGFPTANINYDKTVQLPGHGVYATVTHVGKAVYPSVTNVGVRPTFAGEHTTVEVHILGMDGDLYGEILKVEFIEKIRDEQRFDSPEQLKEQLAENVLTAKELLKHIDNSLNK